MRYLAPFLMSLLLPGCAASSGDASAREWQRAECNRIIDADARDRCMKRIDSDYGSRKGEEPDKPKR
jgi:hypothetical protein